MIPQEIKSLRKKKEGNLEKLVIEAGRGYGKKPERDLSLLNRYIDIV